ncbi:MAG: polysaccharide pyruvyl transferase family protein [Microbacterium sp.]
MPLDSEVLFDALDKKLLGEQFHRMVTRDRHRPAVFLLCTHEWGNIGDLAINYNEVALLERLFPEHPVFPVSRSALAANWDRVRSAITPDDLIAIHGGGNLGDLWPHEEAARLAVVEQFPHNRIVSFPQSIHFDAPAAQERSMRTYGGHERLLLAVRDDRSYEIAARHLGADRVHRAEDIVTWQSYPYAFREHQDRVMLVLRDDKEKRPESGIDAVRDMLTASGAAEVTDTSIPRLPFSNTELSAKLVYNKIDELHASRLVVTDRLHGALFALIAGRPVIVFENSYGKIRGALEHLLPALRERVRFASPTGADVTPDLIERMGALGPSGISPAVVLADAQRDFERRVLLHAGAQI